LDHRAGEIGMGQCRLKIHDHRGTISADVSRFVGGLFFVALFVVTLLFLLPVTALDTRFIVAALLVVPAFEQSKVNQLVLDNVVEPAKQDASAQVLPPAHNAFLRRQPDVFGEGNPRDP
jgi:hypothetical protein